MPALPIRTDHITPTDAKISLADAKKVFRQWMLLTEQLDAIKLPDHVKYFADAVKEEENSLKGDFESAKEEVTEELNELNTQIKKLEREVKKETDAAKLAILKSDLEMALAEKNEIHE